MKNPLIVLLPIIIPLLCQAQCDGLYNIHAKSSWTYDNFNGKGKFTGKTVQEVKSFEPTAHGFKAVIRSTILNEKEKKLSEGDLEMTCQHGTLIIDMRKYIPEEQRKAFDAYEMKIESQNLELPAKLSAGQSLKDGSVILTTVGSPIAMKMTVHITDRKVEGKETITTPAGTFDCWKISSKSSVQIHMGINMNFNSSVVEWMAEKVGMVKSESYDQGGKLSFTTVLSSIR